MVQVILLLGVTVLILFGFSSELELNSEESSLPHQLTATVPLGKRLKLNVANIDYAEILWRFNGKAVSEKCETEKTPNSTTLICTDMYWSDEGLYECQRTTKSGQKEVLLAVNVKIAECTEECGGKQRIVKKDRAFRCFCSGITDDCSIANDLFRIKITANVTKWDMVELSITESIVEESRTGYHESESTMYYSLPDKLKGNLLKSYGGYIDIPSTNDETDEDKPILVLQSKYRTLVYFNDPESSDELRRNRILLTEQNWRHLNNSGVSRDSYLTALSHVQEFYVKHNQYWNFEPIQIVLDSAGFKDHGLGKVTTVEKCKCHDGYKGLSCEYCSEGFYRRPVVREQGICISIREKLEHYGLLRRRSLGANFPSWL